MNRFIPKVALAALAFTGLASAQQPLLEKNGPCGTLARTNTYNGHNVNMLSAGFNQVRRPPVEMTNLGQIQVPLDPQAAINCVVVPPGLKAQTVATELIPGPVAGLPSLAYFLYFTFDEKGRVWAIDSRDYPYTHDTTGNGTPTLPGWNASSNNVGLPTDRLAGQSRIVILEDTDGNGSLDRYKVFYTGLALPTSIEIVKNGVIVSVPPNVYYIQKDATNPDTAATGTPQIVVNNMGSSSQNYDTHGQPNSLTRGLDNWIYGHTGYNGCGGSNVNVTGTGSRSGSCGNGNSYRFKHMAIGSDTSRFEVRSGGVANAHGLGMMEDGQLFKSGATGSTHAQHDVRPGVTALDIRDANGGTGNAGRDRLFSMTRDRYMWEGNNQESNVITAGANSYVSTGISAVSGADFYTARLLPQKYWSRFGFACEGMSGMCNQDSLVEHGASWRSVRLPPPNHTPNIFGSVDAWSAPLKVRTGPEGGLWVLDWYNYLFLHNPASPATNAAYRNPMRGKSRIRLYRIVPADGELDPVLNLENATERQLVATLHNTNYLWRMHAQRLLIERGYTATMGDLLDSILTKSRQSDAAGIDGAVLHAMWTLHGLKQFEQNPTRWDPKLKDLLLHPAVSVRRNVPLVMPATEASYASLREQCAVNDAHAHVRLQALEALSRIPASGSVIESVDGLRVEPNAPHSNNAMNYLGGAFTAAGSSKVTSVAGSARPASCPTYHDTASYTTSVKTQVRQQQRVRLSFDVRHQGFTLKAATDLPSGELVVSDLRGRVTFRSTYNKSTAAWSTATASNMPHPFYFYSFKGVDGAVFNGRISLGQTY